MGVSILKESFDRRKHQEGIFWNMDMAAQQARCGQHARTISTISIAN
jgi:hypothetical protein